jgi:hypothetical protein
MNARSVPNPKPCYIYFKTTLSLIQNASVPISFRLVKLNELSFDVRRDGVISWAISTEPTCLPRLHLWNVPQGRRKSYGQHFTLDPATYKPINTKEDSAYS